MMDEPQYKAKAAICRYWTEETQEVTVLSDLVTVWFCYILGGWKTLMFMNRYPTNYFEVTYNVAKGEMYLDHYKKVHNEAIPDNHADLPAI